MSDARRWRERITLLVTRPHEPTDGQYQSAQAANTMTLVTVCMCSQGLPEGREVALRRGQPIAEILTGLCRARGFENASAIKRHVGDDAYERVESTEVLRDGEEVWVECGGGVAPARRSRACGAYRRRRARG